MKNPFESRLHRLPAFVTCEEEVSETCKSVTITLCRRRQALRDDLPETAVATDRDYLSVKINFSDPGPNVLNGIYHQVDLFARDDEKEMLLIASTLLAGGMSLPFSVTTLSGQTIVIPGTTDQHRMMEYLALYHTDLIYSEWPYPSRDFWRSEITLDDGEAVDPTTGINLDATRILPVILQHDGTFQLGSWSIDAEISEDGRLLGYGNQEVYTFGDQEPEPDHDWETWPRYVSIMPAFLCIGIKEGVEHAFQALPIGHDENGGTWIMGIPVKATLPGGDLIFVDQMSGNVPAGKVDGANPITFVWDESVRQQLSGSDEGVTLFVAFFTRTINDEWVY